MEEHVHGCAAGEGARGSIDSGVLCSAASLLLGICREAFDTPD